MTTTETGLDLDAIRGRSPRVWEYAISPREARLLLEEVERLRGQVARVEAWVQRWEHGGLDDVTKDYAEGFFSAHDDVRAALAEPVEQEAGR